MPPLHPRDRVQPETRAGLGLRRSPGRYSAGSQSHAAYALAHLERGRPLGALCARQYAANNADRRAAQGKGFSYGPTHNLHMLLFAASYDGQGAVATQAGKDYRKYAGDAQFEATTLIRFGRFDEVLELDHRPEGGASAAIYDFAKGYAMLKAVDYGTHKAPWRRCMTMLRRRTTKFAFTGKDVVGVLVNILAGEIQLTEGQTEAAIESFKQAVELRIASTMTSRNPCPLPPATGWGKRAGH